MDILKNEGPGRKEPDLQTYAKWLDQAHKVFARSGGNHVICMTPLFENIAVSDNIRTQFVRELYYRVLNRLDNDKTIVKNSLTMVLIEGKLCIVRHTDGGTQMGMRYANVNETQLAVADEIGKMFEIPIGGLLVLPDSLPEAALTEEEKAEAIHDLGLTFRGKMATLFLPWARAANQENERKIEMEIHKRNRAKNLRENTVNFQLILDALVQAIPDLKNKLEEIFEPSRQKTERIEKPKEAIKLRSYEFINIPKKVETRVILNSYECKITWDTKTGKAVLRLTTQNKKDATIFVHMAPGETITNIDGLSGITIEVDAQGTLLLKNEGGLLLSNDAVLVGCKAQYRKTQE